MLYLSKWLQRQYIVRSSPLALCLMTSSRLCPNCQAETTLLRCWGADHKDIGKSKVQVSYGGLLTRSGSLVSIEGMSLDVVGNSAVSIQHCAWI